MHKCVRFDCMRLNRSEVDGANLIMKRILPRIFHFHEHMNILKKLAKCLKTINIQQKECFDIIQLKFIDECENCLN